MSTTRQNAAPSQAGGNTARHQPDEASRSQAKARSIKACLILTLLLALCALVGTVETASGAILSVKATAGKPVAPPAVSTAGADPAAGHGQSDVDPDAAAAMASHWIGSTRTANFPSDDFGTFWNAYPSY